MPTYATVAQYEAQTGQAADEDTPALLYRASLDVDRELFCAVYNTTDPVAVAALQEATIEQAAALAESGASAGIESSYVSASIGPASVTRAADRPRGDGTSPLCGRAHTILALAGFDMTTPDSGW